MLLLNVLYELLNEIYKLITQRLQVHRDCLATAYVGLKECAITKEFCRYSLPVVSACKPKTKFISKLQM